MLAAAANAITAAARPRAAKACAEASMPKLRSAYSPKTMAMPPWALARMSTSSDQPNMKATGRPQPSRSQA
jgi:hypothetical protein